MDYNVFMRRQLAQDRRMNTIMLEQIYRNLDGQAYDSDDLEYTGEQLVDRAMMQAADYYDVTGSQGHVRREIGAMLSAAAPMSGAD
ncbi:MAG: hypothetical protein OXL37_04230 [Chloroflexota bacterium]|nr:hypothetical protein [Chloroflexota bacterium]MDE2958472.1 hypothetical protein [Chloroflexota bacterium]